MCGQVGGEQVCICFVSFCDWQVVGLLWFVMGDGVGFVEGDLGQFVFEFEEYFVFDQDVQVCCGGKVVDDGYWGGDYQCVGIGDYQQYQGVVDLVQLGVVEQQWWQYCGGEGDEEYYWGVDVGEIVDEMLGWCVGILGFFYGVDDLGQGVVVGVVGDVVFQCVFVVDVVGEYWFVDFFFYWQVFVGDWCLVDVGVVVGYFVVECDVFVGFYVYGGFQFYLFGWQFFLFVVDQYGGLFWSQLQQVVDGVVCVIQGFCFD